MNFQGLPADRFNRQWRAVSTLQPCSISLCDSFIKSHYLRKRPGVVVLCLRFLVLGDPVGMIVYALPPRETAKRYGGKTWELARLYLLDEIPRNAETWCISSSVRYIKRNHSDVEFLVSYADPSVGHSGLIYRAANWKSDGKTDQERKSPRCDYQDGLGKRYSRKSHIPEGVSFKRVPRVSKNRFYLPLVSATSSSAPPAS